MIERGFRSRSAWIPIGFLILLLVTAAITISLESKGGDTSQGRESEPSEEDLSLLGLQLCLSEAQLVLEGDDTVPSSLALVASSLPDTEASSTAPIPAPIQLEVVRRGGGAHSVLVQLTTSSATAPGWKRELSVQDETAKRLEALEGKEIATVLPLAEVKRGLLFLCLGPREPVFALNARGGETVWKIDRLWEFDHCLAGPSRHAPIMSRFGFVPEEVDLDDAEELEVEDDPSEFDEGVVIAPESLFRSARSAQVVRGFIISGENSAEPTSWQARSRFRLCILVQYRPAAPVFGGWRARLYEIDDGGRVLASFDLNLNAARALSSSGIGVAKGRLLVRAEFSSLYCFLPAERQGVDPFWGRYEDCIVNLAWARDLALTRRDAWLWSDSVSLQKATLIETAVIAHRATEIPARSDSILRFHFEAISLQSGSGESFVVEIPFRGRVPEPTANFRGAKGETFILARSILLRVVEMVRVGPDFNLVLETVLETESDPGAEAKRISLSFKSVWASQ
jgi:hypothetical protein